MIPAVLNHLWQSTVFAAAAGLLTMAFRRNSARVRYWLWFAASLKFLMPFSLLVGAGSQVSWRTSPASPIPSLPAQIDFVGQPFRVAAGLLPGAAAKPEFPLAPLLLAMWACGFGVAGIRWWARWRCVAAARRAASPLAIDAPIPVLASAAPLEPGVFGIFRPVLLLPEGIAERLAPEQLQAILAHEWSHVRSRDNLIAAIHMIVEAVFWFHPLVWWIGARMVAERERACDEAVCSQGSNASAYARAILDVCKFYVESPLACAAGVTGANLKKRIEEIMTPRVVQKLHFGKKVLLACASALAIALPLAIGALNALAVGQALPPLNHQPLQFEVASINPSDPNEQHERLRVMSGGSIRFDGVTVRLLISESYDVRDFQISGGPAWIASDRYDISAKPPDAASEPPGDPLKVTQQERDGQLGRMRLRLQSLLADRFQLKLHRETRELPVYRLVVAKNGPKLKDDPARNGITSPRSGMRPGGLTGHQVGIAMLVRPLSQQLGRPVLDETGLKGTYDFELTFTPDQATPASFPEGAPPGFKERPVPDPNGPTIFTAIQEQLGLKLESDKGPVEILVIDHVERPSDN